jgi:rubrerythrin
MPKRASRFVVLNFILLGLVGFELCHSTGPVLAATTTLQNMQTAYDGECNAHARYLAFAAKADAEGYAPVASLFRAVARAEEVHVNSHAKIIRKMGATPESRIKVPEVKSTAENLEFALRGENVEHTTTYPGFVKQAESEKNAAVVRALNGTLVVEKTHAKLFEEVLKNRTTWKSPHKTFLVCTVCGYVTDDLSLKKCPVCSSPREKFVEIK